MNGRTIQNGATNFAKPCTLAASSAQSPTAATGIRGAMPRDAAINPTAQTVSTAPSARPPRCRLSRT